MPSAPVDRARQKTLGQRDEAITSYAVPRPPPGFGDAYWSLANLKTYRFTPEELPTDAGAAGGSAVGHRGPLPPCVLRSARHWRTRVPSPSPSSTTSTATPLKQGTSRSNRRSSKTIRRSRLRSVPPDSFPPACLGQAGPGPHLHRRLPRSGSTLLEQILASHSRSKATQRAAQHPADRGHPFVA